MSREFAFLVTTAAALLLALGGAAHAHDSNEGGIFGVTTLIDGTGDEPSLAPLGGVSVVATNLSTNQNYMAISQEDGMFHLSKLPEGNYRVRFEFAGFVSLVSSMPVISGEFAQLYPRISLNSSSSGCGFTGPWHNIATNQRVTALTSQTISRIPFINTDLSRSTALAHIRETRWISQLHPDFVDEVMYINVFADSKHDLTLGTTRILTPKSGYNDFNGSFGGQLSHSSQGGQMQLVTTLGGPIKKETAWFFSGLAIDIPLAHNDATAVEKHRHQWLSHFDYKRSYGERMSVTHIAAHSGNSLQNYLNLDWSYSFDDAHKRLSVLAHSKYSHKYSQANDEANQPLHAELRWRQTTEAGGHTIDAGIGVESYSFANQQTTHTLFGTLQDSWSISPTLHFNAGIRYELRRGVDLNATHQGGPKLGMVYDWTKEGTSIVFTSIARLHPHTSQQFSVPTTGAVDEFVLGADYMIQEALLSEITYQGRRSLGSSESLDAFTVKLNGRPTDYRDLILVASYTYAKVEGNLVDFDVGPHRLHLNGSFDYELSDDSDVGLGLSLRRYFGNGTQYNAKLRLRYKRALENDRTLELFSDFSKRSSIPTEVPNQATFLAFTEQTSQAASSQGATISINARYSY